MRCKSVPPLLTRRGPRLRSLLAAMVLAMVLIPAAEAPAATGDIGYKDGSWSGTGTATAVKRHESLLWFNDGSWWANMWDHKTSDFHIFRLDTATQGFVDTGVTVDTRASTHADVLWDGVHLYVASHMYVNDGETPVAGSPANLYRFSYDAATKKYTLDPGFPVVINNYKTETLVIDKDTTGKLWATWMQDNKIYVNSTQGDDRTWGTPFALPGAEATVSSDDNSSVVAFGGNKIGVMWSNQTTTNGGMWFAVHNDGDPDGVWQPNTLAVAGAKNADDHINLKAMPSADGGRVFAAVKTSQTTTTQPLSVLLARDPVSGAWSSHTVGRVSDCSNRSVVLIDPEHQQLHVFYTAPSTDGVCKEGGQIVEKTSPLNPISFPVGAGRPVIRDAASSDVHNVSTTKQMVTSTTGLTLLAANTTLRARRRPEPARSRSASPTLPPAIRRAGRGTSATAALRPRRIPPTPTRRRAVMTCA
jgi:hypothetical protein